MQNLGTLDNQYTIVSLKFDTGYIMRYLARQNHNQNNIFIELPKDEVMNAFPANMINILKYIKYSSTD